MQAGRARHLGEALHGAFNIFARDHHEIRRVITNKAVLDFETPDHAMRLRSVHPGVSAEEVQGLTGFPLVVPDDLPETRVPTDEELHLLRDVLDPTGLRRAEVKAS